jgi:thermitase
MQRKFLDVSVTAVFLVALVLFSAPANSHATSDVRLDFSIIEADGTFTFAPDYQPAELPPDYTSNPPYIVTGDNHVRDEVVLRFRAGVPQTERDALMAALGMRMGRLIWGERAFVAKVAVGSAITVTRALQNNPLLEIASLNPIMQLDSGNGDYYDSVRSMQANPVLGTDIPCINDPLAYQQSHLGEDKINACRAWTFSTGLGPVSKIAIIDSGIDASEGVPIPGPTPVPHPDFLGKFLEENWIAFSGAGFRFKDSDGHGTHVAGIALANTNNGTGVAGVGYTAWPMSLKVLDDCITGPPMSNLISAFHYAADHGASVINMSAGFYVDSTDSLDEGAINLLKEAVDFAYTRGLIIVATAGNSNAQRIRYPGAFGEVPTLPGIQDERLVLGTMGTFCMGCPGVDNERRHPNSNYGWWYDFGAPFAVDAPTPPGAGILSTVPTEGSCRFPPEVSYDRDLGTSMAAPQVAGLASLLTTMGFSNSEVWTWIKYGVKDLPCDNGIPCLGEDVYTRYGRIDAGRSMEWAYDIRRSTGPEMVVVPNAGQRAVQ